MSEDIPTAALAVPCPTCFVDAGTPCRSRRDIGLHKPRITLARRVTEAADELEASFLLLEPHEVPVAEADADYSMSRQEIRRMAIGCVLAVHDADLERMDTLIGGLHYADLIRLTYMLAGFARDAASREQAERQALKDAGLLPEAMA